MPALLARVRLSALWSQIAQTGGARAAGIVGSTLTVAITARYLGPEGRGIVAAATGWVVVIAAVGGLSLGQVAIHLAAGKHKDTWLPAIFGSLLIIVAVATAALWIAVAASYFFSGGSIFSHLTRGVLAVAFLALPFYIWSELGLNILLALDALRSFNIAQVVGSLLQLIAVVVLVGGLGLGIYGALGAVTIAQMVIATLCIVSIYRAAPAIRAEWVATARLLKGSAKLHLNAIGTLLFTQTNVIMVNHFCRPEETGYYQLAMQLVAVAQLLPISIGMVAYTIVGRDGADRAWRQQRRLLIQGVGLSIVAIAAGYVAAPIVVTLLAGRSFLPAVPLFRMTLPALVGMTMSLVMASQWIGRGLFLQAAFLTCAIGLLTVAGNAWLLPRFGVVGAVYTVLGVYGVSVFGNGCMAYWVERKWRAFERGAQSVIHPESACA